VICAINIAWFVRKYQQNSCAVVSGAGIYESIGVPLADRLSADV